MENKEMQEISDGLLSIVVPIYKVEKYLNRCVESLVNQTYGNIEIILVDDGSLDRCPEMCDHWAERDSRIRVIHKENGGLSDARNTGIDVAEGKYLAFVDSDDYIDLRMYETMIRAMQCEGAQIACCGRYIVKAESLESMHCMNQQTMFTGTEAIQELLRGGSVEESACDKVYERKLIEGLRFPKGEINEDLVIVLQLLNRAKRIVHVGKPFYYYWQNSESITRSAYSPKKMIIFKHLDEIEALLIKEQPNLLAYLDVLKARYCQSLLYLLLDNKQVRKEYRQDYQRVFSCFQKTFKNRLKLEKMGAGEKIKGYLIYYNLYYFIHEMKKVSKG